MEFYLIIALIIVTIVAIFAIQNAHLVTIKFLLWKFEGSLVLVLLAFFAGGFLTALFLSLRERIKRRRTHEEKRPVSEWHLDRSKSTKEKPAESEPPHTI